jgi:hypothetical protein
MYMPTLTVSAVKKDKLCLLSRKVSDDGITHARFKTSSSSNRIGFSILYCHVTKERSQFLKLLLKSRDAGQSHEDSL